MSYNNQPNPNPTSSVGQIISSDGTSRISVSPGTSGQILTAYSSTASGLGWQSSPSTNPGTILISSTTVTSSVTTLTISNIPGSSYSSLKIVGIQPSGTRGGYIHLNGITTASYGGVDWQHSASSSSPDAQESVWSSNQLEVSRTGTSLSNSVNRSWEMDLFARETSTGNLTVRGLHRTFFLRTDSTSFSGIATGSIYASFSGSSINSFTFAYSNSASLNGMLISIYGVK